MMNYFITTQEIQKLKGLPHLAQITYLLGLRPYMNQQSNLIGLDTKTNYRSIPYSAVNS